MFLFSALPSLAFGGLIYGAWCNRLVIFLRQSRLVRVVPSLDVFSLMDADIWPQVRSIYHLRALPISQRWYV